ncbi:ubx domain protein [Ophiostoma piceae UAMH 11346]|uniref:Ubx domain protein n=1 Tax=Ophiostoma piceae (strain UAMH 11346) TaxID=1262450 RepID=S3D0S4_OPHP1|nr:ubx domain protein [Ophiostoma piceae UAMH 11346]
MDDLVAQLTGITGTSDHIARQLLEMANNDLGQAVVLFYDTDMAAVLARQAPSTSSTAPAASSTNTSRAARAPAHREDGDGVIHIDDSDDDNDVDFEDADDGLVDIDDYNSDDAMTDAADAHRGNGGNADDAAAVALRAQEEEDAAMAKRLQEEMYAEQPGGGAGGSGGAGGAGDASGGWQDEDDIRAPLGRTTETLVDPVYGGGIGGGIGGGYGFGGPSLYQRMRQQRGAAPNPFSQVWDNDVEVVSHPDDDDDMIEAENEAPGSSYSRLSTEPDITITSSIRRGRGAAAPAASTRGRGGAATSRAARLADLFRPPYDLMDHSIRSWDDARAIGKDEKKWILANIQDMSDFLCQALNRDIWKDEAIKQLVRENFVFLQYSKDDMAAESYIQFYMPGGQHENPDNFPHVGIVDPRTGEQVKVWSGRPFPTALEFHAQLAEFLDRYSLDSSKKNPVQRTKTTAVVKDVGRMTEDEMLEMALKNSLETGGGSGSGSGVDSGRGSVNGSRPALVDPDQLTGTPAPEGKGKEVADEAEAEEEASAFTHIAADRPHEEPPVGPTVTRIQFRNPGGRVIRRFNVDDPVERIYEWLKAAPLGDDKEGVEFELKPVPATPGRDLLEELGKTIEEAGLKQATVMIEYIE